MTSSTIEILVDGRRVGTTRVSSQGLWEFTLPRLSVGRRVVTAVTISSKNTRSHPSAPRVLMIVDPAALDFVGAGDSAVTAWRSSGGVVRYMIRRVSSKRWMSRRILGRYGVPGDYDGDGVADIAAVQTRGESLVWNIKSSLSGEMAAIELGSQGDVILGGCKLQSSTKVSLAIFRRASRQLFVQEIEKSHPRLHSLAKMSRGDLLGCGDIDGDGVDEVLFKVPARQGAGANAIAAFTSKGERVMFEDFKHFVRGFVALRGSNTQPDLVALLLGETSKGIPIQIQSLSTNFSLPIFHAQPDSTIGGGLFSRGTGEQTAGMLWAQNRSRSVFRRLLTRTSRTERLFKLPARYRLIRAQNIYRTR